MPTIDLKANHKAVKDYYAGLEEFHRLGVKHETAVRAPFQILLGALRETDQGDFRWRFNNFSEVCRNESKYGKTITREG